MLLAANAGDENVARVVVTMDNDNILVLQGSVIPWASTSDRSLPCQIRQGMSIR